jgi:hypothetical protein
MSRVSTKAMTLSILLCLLIAMFGSLAMASSQTTSSNSPAAAASGTSKNPQAQSSTPSASDIAAAKANGKVWVNLDSGVYHHGGRWYGKTKNGKFMTVDEAKKAGYKAAKRD